MILHTVNKSPHSSHCLSECLSLCADTDSILLIEDGVYAAIADYPMNTLSNVYALKADVEARGLAGKVASTIEIIDDPTFVNLATQHEKVVSWY